MARLLIIILSSLLVSFSQAQPLTKIKKFSTDTIDYSVFPTESTGSYALYKIRQFNGVEVYDMGHHRLLFIIVENTLDFKLIAFPSNLVPGDTLMPFSWYSDSREVHNTVNHLMAVIRLNKTTNTIFASASVHDAKFKQYKNRIDKLKVIKWTSSEIIMKDVSNPDFNRFFYFRRSRT